MSTAALESFVFDQVLPGGFHLPARMTVLPLAGGGIALVSPIPLDDALAARITALGEVRALVAPNLWHHLYLGDASARYPGALVVAPRALREKRPDLRIDADLEGGWPASLGGGVRAVLVEGAPSVDEFALLHEASRTLVLTDLVFHVTRPRGWMAHVTLWCVGCHGKLAQSRAWRWMLVKDRAAAARSAAAILELPFDRLVVAHGDGVPEGAKAALEDALGWMRRAGS